MSQSGMISFTLDDVAHKIVPMDDGRVSFLLTPQRGMHGNQRALFVDLLKALGSKYDGAGWIIDYETWLFLCDLFNFNIRLLRLMKMSDKITHYRRVWLYPIAKVSKKKRWIVVRLFKALGGVYMGKWLIPLDKWRLILKLFNL